MSDRADIRILARVILEAVHLILAWIAIFKNNQKRLTDLNTATQAELETLPDIGPVLARRMISARPFVTLEDLKRVSGMGPILMQRLSPKVWVNKAR